MPRVSAIITAHNEEAFIGAAIHSVMTQDVPAHEIIVVNDASIDGTQAVIDACARAASGAVRGVTLPRNSGAPFARNTGAALADGDALAFLDGDDIWLPNKLAVQSAILDRHPSVGYTYGSAISLRDDTTDATAEQIGSPGGVYRPPDLCIGYLRDAYWNFWPSGLLIRRETFRSSEGFVDALGGFQHWEDFFYACRLALTETCYVSDEALTYYRVHDASCSRRAERTKKTIVDERVGLEWFVGHLAGCGPRPISGEIVGAMEERLERNAQDFANALATRPGLTSYAHLYSDGAFEHLRAALRGLRDTA